MELICAPYFEVIGLNADFGKSYAETLQSKMKELADERQLVIPSENYISATDNINLQISWAKNNGCLYLQQTTLTQLEKNIRVNIGIMNLNTGDYVFENAYKANSANDLPLVFEQIGNTLQHPEFAETKADIVDSKDLAKRKSINQLGSSLGIFYFNGLGYAYNSRLMYLWDMRTLWMEVFFSIKVNSYNGYTYEPGARILYPFSDKLSTFYIGSGGGFSIRENSYGMFVENSLGYLIWHRLPMRIEAVAGAMFHDKKTIGGGLRFIVGLPTAREKPDTLNSQAGQTTPPKEPIKKSIEKEPTKDGSQKKETKFMSRFAYNSYHVSGGPQGPEFGSALKGGIVASVPISNNTAFEPGLSLFMRNLTLNKVIHYDNGYNYYHDFRIFEMGISIPALFKIMPFGGPRFYIEGGVQLDFFGTEDKEHVGYDSRAAFDFGLAYGIGWNIGKNFSFGFRGISGLNNFDNAGRGKPFQFELGGPGWIWGVGIWLIPIILGG
jgi:hypothetical protein